MPKQGDQIFLVSPLFHEDGQDGQTNLIAHLVTYRPVATSSTALMRPGGVSRRSRGHFVWRFEPIGFEFDRRRLLAGLFRRFPIALFDGYE
jgi:hypothetical protein